MPAIRGVLAHGLSGVGRWLSPLGLRLLLAWEFGEAGIAKLHGQNWFDTIAHRFPFPFSRLGAEADWWLATWVELVAAVALLLGLGTRLAAYALWVLTVVAIAAVHWPEQWSGLAELWRGYAIRDAGFGNYKLPLIYLAMLLPLILGGGGALSLDRCLARGPGRGAAGAPGRLAWGLALLSLCLPLAALLPWFGGLGAAAGLLLAASAARRSAHAGRGSAAPARPPAARPARG